MYDIVFISVLQHPQSQNVLIGSNATFMCRIRFAESSISWEELLSSGVTPLTQDEGNGVYIHTVQIEQRSYDSTLTILITSSNVERWNGTILQCSADTGSGRRSSNNATLAIYKSFSK